jgi:hypothetical protein
VITVTMTMMVVPAVVVMLMMVVMVMRVTVVVPSFVRMSMLVVVRLAFTVLVNAPRVPVLVIVVPVSAAISPGFRLEGRLHRFNRGAQALQHVLEHMVGGNSQEAVADLDRNMPVAEMVGRPDEVLSGFACDVQHAFGLGHDFDHPTVTGNGKVPAAENLSARQHEADFLSRYEPCAQPALLARVERQLDLAFHLEAICAARDFKFCLDLDHVRFSNQKRK